MVRAVHMSYGPNALKGDYVGEYYRGYERGYYGGSRSSEFRLYRDEMVVSMSREVPV